MYNKQEWKDEIPDLTRPIMDSGTGKQKTDPQTGRPLFELVQVGTRITSNRLNNMEGGIEAAHTLIEQLAKELGGNFVVPVDGVMGLLCTAQGLKVTWTAGIAYVGGRRYQVPAGDMQLNPTQGQYLYVDIDGVVKKTTSEATAKTGLLLFYAATDTSGIISTTDQRVNVSLEAILKRLDNVKIPDASLLEKGIVQLSSKTNGTSETLATTEKALKAAYDRGSAGVTAAATAQSRADSAYTEATAAKQLGVETKSNVVAALNSIGVSASTSESWVQLIQKMTAVVRATGNATTAQVLSGATFSNATGNNRVGTMPNRSAQSAHQLAKLTEVWPGDRAFMMPPDGYYNGQSWVYALTPDLLPSNIRSGKNILGVAGSMVEGKQFASGYTYASSGTRVMTVSGLSFRPRTVIITTGLPYQGTFIRGVYSEDIYYYTLYNSEFVSVPLNFITEVSANPNNNPVNVGSLNISITHGSFSITLGGFSSNQTKVDYICYA